ncbi:hypothetical protein CesoFtcFv8_026551 [Champsocephalus esox]|uniref:Ig-like domain-containing protein n=1 Tax=Champsocephalus esox TaxID=159716 RepID=A0AAN8GBE1_9TELE|nr:hypothetical protein CesoFtcFv8_026549 [Champsocephalus esox]KAK5875471.1 hypothetical protein CesoFtcFv8_026551 [Champsocephalus esox]
MSSKGGIEPGGVSKTQDAAKGEDVTLDCHVGSDLIVSIKSVEWRFNGEDNVLVYKSRDFSLDDQGAHFRGRASGGDSWDLDKGNLPVNIKSLQESDAGIYSCSVSTGEDPKEIISIQLKVNKAGVEEPRVKDRTATGHSCSTIGDTVLTVLLATSTLLHFLHD